MATEITGEAGNKLVIPEGEDQKIDIVDLPNTEAIEVVVNQTITGLEIDVAGSKAVGIVGKKIKASPVTATAAAGETSKIVFETTKVKGMDFVTEGEGSVDLNVLTGKVAGSTIKTSTTTNSPDSIKFGNTTTVKNTDIEVGTGKDTISFKGAKISGEVRLALGEGTGDTDGKDIVEVNARIPGKGSILISDFDRKDKIKVTDGDDQYKLSLKKLRKGKGDIPDGIVIRSVDGEIFGAD